MNYKKIFPALLLLACVNLFALQAQTNRTTQTIIADVLAQMPAGNQADYTKQLGDLASTGEEGILALAKMLKAPGQGSNAPVEYALGGLANYVSGLKDVSVKQTTTGAFQKALAAATVPETKAFLQDCMRTLGIGYQPAASAGTVLPKVIKKDTPTHIRIAALQQEMLKIANNKEAYDLLFIGTMMIPIEKNKELALAKKVIGALKDPSDEYRNAALDFLSPFAGTEAYTELAKALRKARPTVKADILNWFGRESKLPGKDVLIRDLKVRFDLPFTQVLAEQLMNKEWEVTEAAAWAMMKVGGASSIPLLAGLLESHDEKDIRLGKQTLASFKGDISPAVMRVLNTAQDVGKVAAIELLALRKASTYINNVLEQTKSTSPEVRNAAYAALEDVAGEKDLTLLCGMLETASAETVKPLQQAVLASLSSLPQKEQVAAVSQRMLQAGEGKKHLYYVVLSAIGAKEALPVITNGFEQGGA